MTLETFRQSYDCPRGLEIRQFETHLEAAHLTDHDTAEKVLASLLLIKEVIKEWKKGVEDRGGTLKKQPYYLAISRLRESVKAVLDQPQWKTIRKFFEKMESGGADPFQVVHYYNQGFEPRIINNDDTVNQGWCFGMVLQWIAKKKAGSGDFWT